MRSGWPNAPLGILLCLFLTFAPVQGGDAAIGKATPRRGVTRVNGSPIVLETTIFFGDQVTTEADASAIVVIPGGGQIHLGPSTSTVLYSQGADLAVDLNAGLVRARAGQDQRISINARGLVVQAPASTSFEVAINGDLVLVAARNGDVEVVGTNTSLTIPVGSVMQFEVANPVALKDSSDGGRMFVWTPGNAVWVAVLVSAGISIPLGYILADQLAGEATREGCRRALRALSPSTINFAVCDIPSGF